MKNCHGNKLFPWNKTPAGAQVLGVSLPKLVNIDTYLGSTVKSTGYLVSIGEPGFHCP